MILKKSNGHLATENNDVDLGFQTFFKLCSITLDKHALYKGTRKKEIETLKSWITKGKNNQLKLGTNFTKI